MKVHPAPKKRHVTLRYDVPSIATPLTDANYRWGSLPSRQKKLRRLPHIFAKVLELPFRADADADADVSVVETDEFFRFTVLDIDAAVDVRADTVVIHPGVTKVVVRPGGDRGAGEIDGVSIDEFAYELDLWRFRLPAWTRPELAVASYRDGDLVVTVPKGGGGGDEEEEEAERENGRQVLGDGGNLVLAQ